MLFNVYIYKFYLKLLFSVHAIQPSSCKLHFFNKHINTTYLHITLTYILNVPSVESDSSLWFAIVFYGQFILCSVIYEQQTLTTCDQ